MTRRFSSHASGASRATDPTKIGTSGHRPVFGSDLQRDSDYPPTKWRCDNGLVHVASMASNHALCELVWSGYANFLVLPIREAIAQGTVVTCVLCVGNAWRFEDEFDILGNGARIAQPVPLHRRRRSRG